MKFYNSFYALAAIAAVGLMSSCSSDDEIAAIDDNNVITDKAISTTFCVDNDNEGSETRLGANISINLTSKVTTFKPQIYSDDYFWVYAPTVEGGWFNKLIPDEETAKKGSSLVPYATAKGSTVKFEGDNLVFAIYSAMSDVKGQESHDLANSKFVSKDNSGNTIFTLNRNTVATYDYNLAYVYGESDAAIHYSDKDNPFSFKVASALINSDGYLLHFTNDGKGNLSVKTTNSNGKTEHGSVNIVSYAPKIRFAMPAAINSEYEKDAYVGAGKASNSHQYTLDQFKTYYESRSTEVNDILSKLEYKIVVDAVPASASAEITTGYPNGMTYRLLDITNDDDKGLIQEQNVIEPNGVTFSSDCKELKLYYGTSTDIKNTSLWNTGTPTLKNDGNKLRVDNFDDFCTGDVYVSLPSVAYKRIRVLVNVSYTGDNEAIKTATAELCHTYKKDLSTDDKIDFSFTKKTDNIKDIVSAVYDLGSIWGDRTTFIGKTNNAPSVDAAPAKAKANNGWEIADDEDFNF